MSETAITKSDEIRNCVAGVYANPYQGQDKRVVFVCSMGILRSATAARIYAGKYNTRTAGTYGDALVPLSAPLILWADEVVFVNRHNYDHAVANFGHLIKNKTGVKVLDIPDCYEHMHPELIREFERQYEPR